MKARRSILQALVGLLLVHFVVLYILMFVFVRGLSEALTVSLFAVGGTIFLIYPASWLAHLKGGKHAAYGAMGWVVLILLVVSVLSICNVFLGKLSLPWNTPSMYEIMPQVLVTLFACGAVQVLALYLKQFKPLTVAAWLLVVIAGYCAILTCAGFVVIPINRNADMFLGYAWVGSALGFLAACICVGPWRWHKYVGLGFLFAPACLFLWSRTVAGVSGHVTSIANFICVFALAYAHHNVLWQMSLDQGRLALIRLLTQGLLVTVLILISTGCILLWQGMDFRSNTVGLLMGLSGLVEMIALLITGGLLFYVAMVRIRINRRPADNQINYSQLQVVCPHCQTSQLLTASGQCCTQCRLQFNYRLTEPRCPSCDYLLIGYNKDTCPECGEALGSTSEPSRVAAD